MAFLPSLPEQATLRELFARYPDFTRPLLRLHEVLLREQSALSAGEKELIAAYTSTLNACSYCHDIHRVTAEAFGIAPSLLDALARDPANAPVDERMRALLHYVRLLTEDPARISPDDAAAVLAAGWSEDALFEAVATCALFNCMNRLVEGLGITASVERKLAGGRFLHTSGYAAILAEIGHAT